MPRRGPDAQATGRWASLIAATLAAVLAADLTAALLLRDPGPKPARGSEPAGGAVAAIGGTVTPEEFGAVGDGRTDDTEALQRALDSLDPRTTLVLAAGRVFRHDGVLVAGRLGGSIVGPGTLLAGNEERSSLQLRADGVRLRGVSLHIAGTTRRWTGMDQHRLVLGPHAGITVEGVRVQGSAAAGVYVDGASAFRLDDLEVEATRADGVHVTGGARDGLVRRPVLRGTGDDGVAVVSYVEDRDITRRITVESPRVLGTSGGRGVSVVGGEDVVFRDVVVEDSSAAAVYVATEGAPYFTHGVRRVQVDGARLSGANADPDIDHGAVLVFSGTAQGGVEDVLITDVSIRDTRPSASRQIGILGPGPVSGVVLRAFRVDGGGALFGATVAPVAYRVEDWVHGGQPVPPIGEG